MSDQSATFILTDLGRKKINDFKKTIIMKKIMLNYIIDSYAWWDKAYRWTHAFSALAAFMLGTADKIIGTNDATTNLFIILAGITAVMVKVKDYLKFDKIRDLAKDQNVKYKQLFERIDRELMKPEKKQQTEDDFIYWINREFNNIEMSDPELSHSERKKFIEDCKSKGIPYDSDIELLNSLGSSSNTSNVIQSAVLVSDPSSNVVVDVHPGIQSHILSSNIPTNVKSQITSDDNQPNIQPTRFRSPSDEKDRQNYKNTLKTLNTKDDLRWAMERLNNL